MERCKTCRFYSVEDVEGWDADGGMTSDLQGQCDLSRSVYGLPVAGETLAWAQDGEQYSAVLRVRPDFGCVQHELKDAAG